MEKVGDMGMINCNSNSSEICRCKELIERSVKAEMRSAELELELQKQKEYCEALEAKLNLLETQKIADKPKSLSISGEVSIIENDDEPNIIAQQQPELDNQDSGNNEFLSSGTDVQFTATCKRKRTLNVVTSDSENDDDDMPISQLKRMHFLKVRTDQVRCNSNELVTATSPKEDLATGTVTYRRRLRKGVIKSQQDKKSSFGLSEEKHEQSISTNKETCDDELVEGSSDNDSDESDYEDTSSTLQEGSDGEAEFDSHDVSDSQEDKKLSCEPSEDKHEQSVPTNKETDESEQVSSYNKGGRSSDFIEDDSDVSEGISSKSQDASDDEAESDSHDGSDGQEDKKLSCESSKDKYDQSILTNKETDEDDESEHDSSDIKGSLRNFIEHDSDVSDGTSSKSHDASDVKVESDSQDVSDEKMSSKEIFSPIQRKKTQERKWEFEGDMLAAFGKNPILCMKAVCTLYRQQTSEEQTMMASQQVNGKGFSKFDAYRF